MLILIKSQNQVELQTFCRTTEASPTPWENPFCSGRCSLLCKNRIMQTMWCEHDLAAPKSDSEIQRGCSKSKGISSDFNLMSGFERKCMKNWFDEKPSQFTSIHINSSFFWSLCLGWTKEKKTCTELGQGACTRRRSPIASRRDRRSWRCLDAQWAQWGRKCWRNNKKSQWNVEVCPKGDDWIWWYAVIWCNIMKCVIQHDLN